VKTIDTKQCSKCSEVKNLRDFPKCSQSKDGIYSRCKQCVCAEKRAYYAGHRDEHLARAKKWSLENPGKRSQAVKKWLERHPEKRADVLVRSRLKLYGITKEMYDIMHADQNGVCAVCKKEETAIGKGGKVRALSVDHAHITGKIRRLLCHRCNVIIGLAHEDSGVLRNLADYLDEHVASEVTPSLPLEEEHHHGKQISCETGNAIRA